MKKIIYSAMAVAMLATTSCKDDFAETFVGDQATVEFSISTPEIGTRAYSDGQTATVLQYAVYDETGAELTALTKTDGEIKGSTTVSLELTTGETYSVIFWAAAPEAPYTVDFGTKTMTVNYTNAKSNDEKRDAFYKYHTFTVSGAQTETIELRRPFAQLNIGTEDYQKATNAGYTPNYSYVKVPVSSTLNLKDGSVGEASPITFGVAPIKKDETFPVAGNQYISMNYLLVPADKGLVDVEFGYSETETGKAKTRTISNVPVQRNYRTNIYGKLLTSEVDVNVEIKPGFDEPAHEAEKLYIAAACGGTVTLTEDVELPKSLIVADDISMIINLNGHSIINKSGSTELEEGDGIIVYGDLTINGEGTVQGNTRAVWARGNTGAKVRINGGNYVGAFDGNMTEVIYASGNGKIDIYGGTFEAKTEDTNSFAAPQYAVLNLHGNGAAGCDIKVYGGSFKNFNPADNISENPKHNFCAEGYTATKVGDNYVVVAEEIQLVSTTAELQAAFENGGTVILADDVELTGVLTVKAGAEVYLDMNGKKMTVDAAADPAFYTYKGSTLVIDGNGTVELTDPALSLVVPGGDVVIENGTFVRNVPAGTPANQVGALFVGMKVSPWGSQTVTINGGYFDGGYYNADAADIEDILAGTKTFEETTDDIAKRGNSKDANKVRVALKQNVQLLLNLSSNLFKIYGGTFVGANPAWGDEGCMLPTSPNYLRPWSYYQGALLDGQTFHEDGIVLPDGYTITKSTHTDGRPIYTVEYSK